jgi:hypothetical protein
VAAFGSLMTGQTLAMLERWRPAMEGGEPLDLPAEMARLALDVVTGASSTPTSVRSPGS